MSNLHADATEQLRDAYLKTLNSFDLEGLHSNSEGLSGIFLPSVPVFYFEQDIKVMLVGQEAKSWRDKSCEISTSKNSLVCQEAVNDSMIAHAKQSLARAGKSKLLQFYKTVNKSTASRIENEMTHVVWSNLFSITYKRKSPKKSKAFIDIKALSRKLLLDQMNILKPNVILFVTGSSYDKYIKEFFSYNNSHCYEPGQLWGFTVDGSRCFRTHHPRSGSGHVWRMKALQLIMNPPALTSLEIAHC